jgi:hypothetical protein
MAPDKVVILKGCDFKSFVLLRIQPGACKPPNKAVILKGCDF